MKRIIHIFCLFLLPWALCAVPAWRGPIVRTQSDGTEKTVYLHGDQFFHYLTDEQGQVIRLNEQGMYEQAEQLTEEQIASLRALSPAFQARQRRIGRLNLAPRGLIIMANFSDLSFRTQNTREAFDEMHNGTNYTYGGATGSAREYFIDQSLGQYQPHFDVVGPVNLPHNMTYYGENDRYGSDRRATQMIIDACDMVKAEYPEIDFSQYDNDRDGFVDFVFVVYAGHNEANGADPNTIWPHNYYIYSGSGITHVLDGVKLDNYACSSELQGYFGQKRAGIGTFCHEFSHVLGLPDLYSTNGAAHKTLGQWDILDYGPYNNNSNTPPAYSAYERFYMGWTEPEVLVDRQNIRLEQLQSSNKCYLLCETQEHNLYGVKPSPADFYLLENRQQTDWDSYLPGHGLLITHIRYSQSRWSQNTVNNNEATMGVNIVEADGLTPTAGEYRKGYYGKQGDAFPYDTINYFTAYPDQPITNIKESNDGIISFWYKGGRSNIIDSLWNDPQYKPQVINYYTPDGKPTGADDLNDLQPGLYIIQVDKDPVYNKKGRGKKVLIVK